MKVLVTGGIGYIGSHCVVELLNNNYEVIVIDNFSNSKREVIDNIKKITGKTFHFYEGDVCNKDLLRKIFKDHSINAVIHFAGYKSVGESIKNPLMYYKNNLESTINLCEVMNENNVKNLVFSSSATVYGNPKSLPILETDEITEATNTYGQTKIIIEKILKDLYISDSSWNIAILRYFNPIGAHESGLIGENPNGIPNNLMPYILKVATRKLPYLSIFGNDYNTPDKTAIRDYIHVVDLAKGHIKALEWLAKNQGLDIFNLGTGKGYSVLEIVLAFEKYNNVDIPYKFVERRPGDVEKCYANVEHAYKKLNWKSEKNLEDMVKDSYNFALKNESN